ncbi:hypothetical protein [Enemella evansiae]|uniref:hypothetical protein n=1 Tax=Enemella evansiae TaxID=2016499 RepID=UPI000B95F00F|nr:hypothetical protein [Enemella evansiae]OYO02407.1 hypothetical protein CGZ97_13350 [Enemella evansiae]
MADFLVRARSPLPPPQALAALFDLDAHTAVIPLTTVTHDGRGLRAGAEFTARTAIGPVGFDDVMRVLEWTPPAAGRAGRVLIGKGGRLLGGRIEVLIRPAGTGSVVEWRQELLVRGVPRGFDPVVARVGAAAYGTAIRRLLARGGRRTIAA